MSIDISICACESKAGSSAPAPGFHKHQIGGHVAGERLLDSEAGSSTWGHPHDVTATVKYSSGAKITSAVIEATVSSNSITDRLISGGIGQGQISFDILAPHTSVFNYNVSIYGI